MLIYGYTQRGITLVELMIASAIALFALSAVITVYSATARHSAAHLQQANLHQQLHATLSLLSSDLKRSGYWQFDPRLKTPAENPFQRVEIASFRGQPARSCILFAYDLDKDGLLGHGHCGRGGCPAGSDDDNVEQFGYRLRDGIIQSRYGGEHFSCDSGYWQAVTDRSIEITTFEFTPVSDCTNLAEPDKPCAAGAANLVRRAVETRVAGNVRGQPDTAIEVSRWTWIRNDLVQAGDR